MTLPKNGTGATTPDQPTEGQEGTGAGNGSDGPDAEGLNELFKVVDAALMGRGGESMVMDELKRHVVTKVTNEGMVIELFDDEEDALFEPGTDKPSQLLDTLMYVIADAAKIVENDIAVTAHVRSNPIVAIENPVWDLSSQRATRGRLLLEKYLDNQERVRKVTGYADRKPQTPNKMDVRNNRLEVIFLRE